MTFKEWMGEVDKIVSEYLGLTTSDLPDENYMVYFEDEYTPKEMAETVLENNDMSISQWAKYHNNF